MHDVLLTAADFRAAPILLAGPVDQSMYDRFRSQLAATPTEGLCVVELSTLGGDPEIARMMGEDIRFHSDLDPRPPLRLPGQGGDLLRGDDVHELLRAARTAT